MTIAGTAVGVGEHTRHHTLPERLRRWLCRAGITTFSYETLRLAEDGARFFASADVVASVVAGLGAAFVGVALAEALWA